MVRTLSIETTTHGRVIVDDTAGPEASLLVAFHGYGQDAESMMAEARRIPGVERWRVAAVQGLHRFYTRETQRVIASWMTRQDRDQAIADNLAYVGRVIEAVGDGGRPPKGTSVPLDAESLQATSVPLVFVGFSQGAAMAYRAALGGRHRAAGVIALGGDIPPDVYKLERDWPPVLVGAGDRDSWYTADRLAIDIEFLQSHAIQHEVVRFSGGHLWTDEFRAAAGRFLGKLRT